MIPKTINYCWFGHGKKPDNFEAMRASWEKYCPDYQIIEWNETNYDVHANEFLEQAYEMKKYAFVSDFARLDIINRHGGIYVDVDVEFLKPIESIRLGGPFFAMEEIDRVNTGLIFGAEKGDSLIAALIDIYQSMDKTQAKHSIEFSNTVEIVTAYLHNLGFRYNGKRQSIQGHTVYETAIFCPQQFGEREAKNLELAYATHHYNSSWATDGKLSLESQYRHARVSRRIKRYLGIKAYRLIFAIYSPLFGRGKQ